MDKIAPELSLHQGNTTEPVTSKHKGKRQVYKLQKAIPAMLQVHYMLIIAH